MVTKKEVMKKYDNGEIKAGYIYNLSIYSHIIILHACDDYVLGFHQFGDVMIWFKRKIYFPVSKKGSPYFKLDGYRYKLYDFGRCELL